VGNDASVVALAGAASSWMGTRGVILLAMGVAFLVSRLFAYAREHKLGLTY